MNGQPGLTTTKAPFIEEVRARDQLFIHQPYELYTGENQETWRRLYARILPRWERCANEKFLQGVHNLALDPERIPRLEEINRFLEPLSGFQARAVSGYIPAYLFFECLRNRQFPTTITIRDIHSLDYLPEPDIFHDVAGHVPMHTDRTFADVLVRFGQTAHTAAEMAAGIQDTEQRLHQLEEIIKAMARFFWFTVEFGLMREKNSLKVYGSGLLSSFGEIHHALQSPGVERRPFQLEEVVNQAFEIDHYQPLLFIVDSFDHLYSQVETLEEWILQGRLKEVAPGEPETSEEDLRSFLHLEPSSGSPPSS